MNIISPSTQSEILKLLHLDIKKLNLNRENAYKVFIDPSVINSADGGVSLVEEGQVPEFLRSVNALKYSEKFRASKYPLLAKYSWATAWAYRRIVTQPMTDSTLLQPVNRIMANLKRKFPLSPTPEKRVNEMVVMYKDHTLYPLLDRQVMLIIMSGDYIRLGFRRWARDCLKSVLDTARSDSAWQELIVVSGREKVSLQRALLDENAAKRLYAIDMEVKYLTKAAEYLRRSLILQIKGKKLYSPEEIPANVYLVGEFERRLENYGRSYAWLDAASKMQLPKARTGAEIWAAEQIDTVLSITGEVPKNPAARADRSIIAALDKIVYNYNQQFKKKVNK
jgi:hypothetical protein